MRGSTAKFSESALKELRVLVIANALAPRNAGGDWSLPTPPAFSPDEVAAVAAWVKGGGALMLIVDHMPFPGANATLAAAFGFSFSNGYAQDGTGKSKLTFRRADANLGAHAVVRGRSAAEAVDTVVTFTGSAFRAPPDATVLFTLPKGSASLETKVASRFEADTPRADVSGWSQGAVLKFGRGRVAVFGEAAMFSAQLAGADQHPMGINDPLAKQNPQFLLNVIHWLSGVIE